MFWRAWVSQSSMGMLATGTIVSAIATVAAAQPPPAAKAPASPTTVRRAPAASDPASARRAAPVSEPSGPARRANAASASESPAPTLPPGSAATSRRAAPAGDPLSPVPARPAQAPSEAAPPVGAGTPTAAGRFPLTVSFGAQLYWDGGSVSDSERRSIAVTDGSFEFNNDRHLSLSADVLKQTSQHFRFGAGARYYFLYDYTRKDDQASSPRVSRLGNLFELLGRAEYVLPVSDKLGFHFGGHGGPAILFPSGELDTTIQALKQEGVNVWDSPRLGYVVGVHVGTRYRIHERIYLRPELDLSWEHLFLFRTKQTVTGVPFEKRTSADMTRTTISLAIELVL